MLAIELVSDPADEGARRRTSRRQSSSMPSEHGLLLLKSGIYSNCIRVLTPLVITDAELDEALGVWEQALEPRSALSSSSRQGTLARGGRGDRGPLRARGAASAPAACRSVFRARDRLLERSVALKILHEQYSEDEEYVERFRREARAVAQLAHPNIVTVIDRGEQDGRQFIVFEFIEGENLKELIEREGPLPVRDAIELAIQVARALASRTSAGSCTGTSSRRTCC